jgi:hypothetical protein
MFEKEKKIKELKKHAHQLQNKEYDNEGREVIRMQVRDDSNFLSMYSPKNEVVISSEVSDFLDNAIKSKRLNNDLHIIISSNVIDDNEKLEYQRGIKNYYRLRILDLDRRLKSNLVSAILMILVAIFIFVTYIILELHHSNYILLQLIDISAWVFVWEAVDLFFLERKRLKYEQLRDCSLYDAKISYEKIA